MYALSVHFLSSIIFDTDLVHFRFIPDGCDVIVAPGPAVLVIEKYESDLNVDIDVTGQVYYENNTWNVKFKDCEDYESGECPYSLSLPLNS